MASNASASGISNDTAKKRKGPPSANEIFSDPVIVSRSGDTASNGDPIVAPVKIFPVQSQNVWPRVGFNAEELTPHVVAVIFTLLSFFTRLYRIGKSDIVTWDEAHFGKFGSHYLKREFYFDVHPPLGKMLVGLSGYMAGYNGSFEFKSGEVYPEELNYVFMRVFNAVFGILCVPLVFYTARTLKYSNQAVYLVTLMVLCGIIPFDCIDIENSYATISRFILLDSMLLFFTATTMFSLVKFHSYRKQEFSPAWWIWLCTTGISIGCVISVKWVGLFGMAVVGLYTIEDLWHKFGDLNMPPREYARHWASRVWGLIMLPLFVYMLSFYLHFLILENSGPGDAQMSSLFQANLKGSDLPNSPLEIAFGSKVTIKNAGYGGGLLHSHVQLFPEGSQQQQVTCYHHKDANNEWTVFTNRFEPDVDLASTDLRFLKDNDVIRLIHAHTGRNLHSHQVSAPVTKSENEVSCYGNLTVGDDKDHCTVEVVEDLISRDRSRIRTLMTTFRLKHTVLGCYLKANNVNLPQWGFKQIEVTCTKENNAKDTHTHWNVESHWNEKLPESTANTYKSPFWRDFVHLNVAMMTSNNALVPDPDKQDDLASQAWQWPILNVGLRMCGWDEKTIKYFLLGNPITVWSSTASIGIFGIVAVIYLLRWQRHYIDFTPAYLDHIHFAGIYPLLGWGLHYLPFFIMGRVLYVHHYLPALYFAILVEGFVFDHFTRNLNPTTKWGVFAIAYIAVAATFIHFKDISFGMEGDSSKWKHLNWLPKWRIADRGPEDEE